MDTHTSLDTFILEYQKLFFDYVYIWIMRLLAAVFMLFSLLFYVIYELSGINLALMFFIALFALSCLTVGLSLRKYLMLKNDIG